MSYVICPKCKSTNTCYIVYGLMDFTPDLNQKLEAGKIHLGGCVVTDEDPNRHCNDCGLDFNTKNLKQYQDNDGT